MLGLVFLVLLAFVSDSYSQVILNHSAFPNTSECGINPITDRIFGGQVAELDEYPWMAAIEYKDKYDGNLKIKCGGSLVTQRHIVTAAHCINSPHTLTRAWIGDWKLSSDPDCRNMQGEMVCNEKVQKIRIARGVYHPSFDEESIKNDVGVIILENNAKFNSYVKPICLPSHTLLNPPRGTTLFSAGWGLTENGTASDVKLKVELPIKRNSECNSALFENLVYGQLCVGGEDGKDTCGGDSGGPLMNFHVNISTSEQNWYLIGVVSYGYDCGVKGFPAIYTRTASYVPWIVSTISKS